MEQRRLTEKEIIDAIIAEATFGRFKGDERDGETPPITIQNFANEMARYAARARLSRLSYAELLTEAIATLDHVKATQERRAQYVEEAERIEREEAAGALRQRQAKLGRRSRLQPAILAAARHYRGQGMNAGRAWDAVRRAPFATDDGSTVEIEGGRLPRLEQHMRVRSRDGRQQKRPIGFNQWQQVYWSAAGSARLSLHRNFMLSLA